MAKISPTDHEALDQLTKELNLLRIGEPSAVASALAEFRQLAELDSVLCLSARETTSGWALERLDSVGISNATRFRQLVATYLEHEPGRYGWFDGRRPEASQRNVVLHLLDLVSRDEFQRSGGYQRVLAPCRLDNRHTIRTLICDGPDLLAWFGALHSSRADARQVDLMISMIPALRRRLAVERRLLAIHGAALEVVLDRLGAPAFILSASGHVYEANELGRQLLDGHRMDVCAAVKAALVRQSSKLPIELVRIRERGVTDVWLAIVQPRSRDNRMSSAIDRAVTRFRLTPRQRDVLELVVRGQSNTHIAERLGITERAVEQHMSAMFDRTRVISRAALISLVLLER